MQVYYYLTITVARCAIYFQKIKKSWKKIAINKNETTSLKKKNMQSRHFRATINVFADINQLVAEGIVLSVATATSCNINELFATLLVSHVFFFFFFAMMLIGVVIMRWNALLKEKMESFWPKKLSQCELKINRPLIPSNSRIYEWNWLDIESQFDTNILQLLGIPDRILVPPVTQLFRSKWFHFFVSVKMRVVMLRCMMPHHTMEDAMNDGGWGGWTSQRWMEKIIRNSIFPGIHPFPPPPSGNGGWFWGVGVLKDVLFLARDMKNKEKWTNSLNDTTRSNRFNHSKKTLVSGGTMKSLTISVILRTLSARL